MIIPIEFLSEFYRFISATFDIIINQYNQEIIDRTGEYTRFMLFQQLYVVRKQNDEIKNPKIVEVWSSDKERLEKIESTWMFWLARKAEEKAEDQEAEDQEAEDQEAEENEGE